MAGQTVARRVERIPVRADVFRWARVSAGYSLEAAARRAGVKSERLRDWESSADALLTGVQVEKFADIYKRPVSALFLLEPPVEPPLPVDFRRHPSSEPELLSPASILAIRRARYLQSRYEEDLLGPEDSMFERIPEAGRTGSEQLAERIRQLLGIPVTEQRAWGDPGKALRSWRRSVEGVGVLVFQFSSPVSELRGFSLPGRVPVIVLNSKDVAQARVFTLFHELSHLLIRSPGMCRPSLEATDAGERTEVYCNAFAGRLLVPSKDLLASEVAASLRSGALNPESAAERLATGFSVSRIVGLRALLDHGLIRSAVYRQVVSDWEERAKRGAAKKKSKGGPTPARKALSELGSTFVAHVLHARERSRISDGDVSDFLGVKLRHLPKIEGLLAAE